MYPPKRDDTFLYEIYFMAYRMVSCKTQDASLICSKNPQDKHVRAMINKITTVSDGTYRAHPTLV